ncbi:unnamed protein product, partial [Durusdinium trenchii]
RLSILASLLGVGAPRAEKGRKMHSGRRHAGMQEMILKDRKWTAKAIQEFRERKVAKDTVVKAEATSAEGAQGDSGQNAALKFSKGCLLPNNVPYGPSVYYTGCGRRRF